MVSEHVEMMDLVIPLSPLLSVLYYVVLVNSLDSDMCADDIAMHYLRRRSRRTTRGHGCLQRRWRNRLHWHKPQGDPQGAQHFMSIKRSGDDTCIL